MLRQKEVNISGKKCTCDIEIQEKVKNIYSYTSMNAILKSPGAKIDIQVYETESIQGP